MMIGGARVEPKRKIFEILREKNSKHLISCSQKGAKHTKFRFRKYPNMCVVSLGWGGRGAVALSVVKMSKMRPDGVM